MHRDIFMHRHLNKCNFFFSVLLINMFFEKRIVNVLNGLRVETHRECNNYISKASECETQIMRTLQCFTVFYCSVISRQCHGGINEEPLNLETQERRTPAEHDEHKHTRAPDPTLTPTGQYHYCSSNNQSAAGVQSEPLTLET